MNIADRLANLAKRLRFSRSAIVGRWPELGKLEFWLATILPVWLAMWIALNIGPQFQYYAVRSLTGTAPSLYGNVFENQIVRIPSLTDWLIGLFDPVFAGISLAACVIAFTRKTPRGIVFTFWWIITVLVSAYDVVLGLLFKLDDAFSFLTNIIANTAGAGLLALILAAFLYLRRPSQSGLPVERWISSAFGISASASLAVLGYVVVILFFDPSSVKVRVYLSAPQSGYFYGDVWAKSKASDTRDRGKPKFDFLAPSPQEYGSIEIRSPMSSPRISWSRADPAVTYDLDVYLFTNCPPSEKPTILDRSPGAIHHKEVTSSAIEFDRNSVYATTSALGRSTPSFRAQGPSPYWLTGDLSQKGGISFFVTDDDRLSASIDEDFEFMMSAPLLRMGPNNKPAYTNRSVQLAANGEKVQISFVLSDQASAAGMKGKILKCAPVESSAIDRSGKDLIVRTDSPFVAVGEKFTRRPDSAIVKDKGSTVSIDHGNGWIDIDDVKLQTNDPVGPVAMLTFKGEGVQMTLDGQVEPLDKSSTIVLLGGLSGYTESTGKYAFVGQVDVGWKDDERLNPTRWERIRIELQIFLLGLATMLVGAIGGLLVPVLRWLFRN